VFEDYWKEFIYFTKNCEAYGILPSQIKGIVNIDGRELRAWKNQNKVPKLYNKNEFEFTKENLYWLGLHYSDGYLRNNGSKFSFTWQQNSSNPFQGYWFPQFIQTYFDIFKHKQKRSMTYIKLQKGNWGFVNNLSGISPIFILAMKNENIISKRNKTKISGYSKIFSSNFLKNIKYKEVLFQGIFDGDGCAKVHKGILLSLSVDHTINYKPLIRELKLVTTSFFRNEIRLAPSSLKNLEKNIPAKAIINQIEFMIEAAKNSIRPDKVYGLIDIIKYISAKKYGTHSNCLPIQNNIRKELLKINPKNKIRQLKKMYPVKNDKYQIFRPKWSEKFCSNRVWKQEFWDFFLNQEFLIKGNYNKNIDFSDGVPINFKL
ncbi:MAG: hypothetical protein J7K26_01335, partial [Candidatus Aenigmarchaeota archaeon]|nr:hypothetical protein [Candidatus Aenigmarchaeota archaeon]